MCVHVSAGTWETRRGCRIIWTGSDGYLSAAGSGRKDLNLGSLQKHSTAEPSVYPVYGSSERGLASDKERKKPFHASDFC